MGEAFLTKGDLASAGQQLAEIEKRLRYVVRGLRLAGQAIASATKPVNG